TKCINHLADSAKFKGVTFNKICVSLKGSCFQSPNDTIHVTRYLSHTSDKSEPTPQIKNTSPNKIYPIIRDKITISVSSFISTFA
ncbi:MAG: hypothetical protein PHI32_11925, partial [Dysgonamonadaceae bacterium]|nr:hypothetical protein [Dysgonamonadaceae bacterium]MDD4730000.1 hypothetical protein [Dysgonamonadaceae bacterium]